MSSQPGAAGAVIKLDEPLKPYTTFKIGGPARFFVCAAKAEQFRETLALAARHTATTFVIDDQGVVRKIDQSSEALDPNGAIGACPLPKKK